MTKTKKKTKQSQPVKKKVDTAAVRRRQIEITLFAVILLLTLSLRLVRIDSPLLDFHAHRQTQTASTVRAFATQTWNFFQPRFLQIDANGKAPGATEMEFPIYQYILGLASRVTGIHEIMGRLLSVLFGLGAAAYVWALARRYFGLIAAVGAGIFYAIDPVAVFFNRTYQPDTMALFFFIGGIYHLSVWFDDRQRNQLMIAAIMTALSLLIKPPVIVMLAPWIIYEFINRRLWEQENRRDLVRLIGATTAILGSIAVWYLYSYFLIFKVTGLTVIRGRYSQPVVYSKYWTSPQVYAEAFKRVWLILTPIGASMLGGAFFLMWRDKRARMFSTLILGHFLYFVLVGEYNIPHYYYQLPLIPVAAISIGWLAAKFIELGRRYEIGKLAAPVLAACVFMGAGFMSYSTCNRWYRVDIAPILLDAAEKVSAATGPEARVWVNNITFCDFNYYSNTNMPYIKFYKDTGTYDFIIASNHLEGSGNPPTPIEKAMKLGVRYVVWLKYQDWSIKNNLPETAKVLIDEPAFTLWDLNPEN